MNYYPDPKKYYFCIIIVVVVVSVYVCVYILMLWSLYSSLRTTFGSQISLLLSSVSHNSLYTYQYFNKGPLLNVILCICTCM